MVWPSLGQLKCVSAKQLLKPTSLPLDQNQRTAQSLQQLRVAPSDQARLSEANLLLLPLAIVSVLQPRQQLKAPAGTSSSPASILKHIEIFPFAMYETYGADYTNPRGLPCPIVLQSRRSLMCLMSRNWVILRIEENRPSQHQWLELL